MATLAGVLVPVMRELSVVPVCAGGQMHHLGGQEIWGAAATGFGTPPRAEAERLGLAPSGNGQVAGGNAS
jgi:hypothetical protein